MKIIYNPIFSIIRFFYLFITGKVTLYKENIFYKKLKIDTKEYTVFRHISVKEKVNQKIKGNSKNSVKEFPAVLVLRFKFKHNSLKWDKFISFFQIPIFVGLPGFQEKIWSFDKKNGIFQGIYQWENENYLEEYLNSFAVNFVRNKAVKNSVESRIYSNTTLKKFIQM